MAKGVIGIQLYSVREELGTIDEVAHTFEKLAQIGYTAIEGFHSHEDPMARLDAKEILRLASDNGLTIVGVHWPWQRLAGDLDHVIEEHLALGNTLPTIAGMVLGPTEDPAAGLRRFQAEMAPVVTRLQHHGLHLTYHNPFQQLVRIGRRYWFDLLREGTDPAALSFEPDTGWLAHAGADPAQWIRKLAGRMTLLHCKDLALTQQRAQEPNRLADQVWAAVGEGNLNWPEIMAAAGEVGTEYYIVEQDDSYGRDTFETLAINYNNLRSWGVG